MMIGGGGNDTQPSTSSTSYTSPFQDGASTTKSTITQRMPTAGTLSQLGVTLGVSPGPSNSYTMTVEINNTASSVTCSINSNSSTCTDTSHTVAFAAGDTLTLRITPNSSPSVTSVRWTALVTG